MRADDVPYWVMTMMKDLTYILIQQFHENQSNQRLESGMLALDPLEWSSPATFHILFSDMAELRSRIELDRGAVSLLEVSMYSVISQNKSHRPYMRAEYNHGRKEAKKIVAAESGSVDYSDVTKTVEQGCKPYPKEQFCDSGHTGRVSKC